MSTPVPGSCPGSSLEDPHKYNPVPGKSGHFSCDRCNRTMKYDDISKSWKVVYRGMMPPKK